MARTTDARRIANHQLVTTLHLPKDTEIRPETSLLEQQILTLTEEDWQHMAKANHITLKQAEATIHLNEQKVKQEWSERIPHISLVAAEHLDGPITIEVPTLDNNFNYWYVGIGVKYNLSSLFKNNRKLKQARLNVRQAQEQRQLAQEQVENSVQEGYVNFLTAFTDLRTQKNSVKLADENYDVIDNYRETQLPNIKEGAEVSFTADAVPGVVYKGVVESISDATGAAFSLIPQDNATGNFVKVELHNPCLSPCRCSGALVSDYVRQR